jgi:hypothetical protein
VWAAPWSVDQVLDAVIVDQVLDPIVVTLLGTAPPPG